VSFESALEAARERPTDPDVLEQLARSSLSEGEEERGLAALAPAVAQCPSARLWQWKGLLERSIDEHGQALRSLGEAARLDPADASIAHGLARVALEAGLPAEHLFETARRLAPNDGSVLLGLAAARVAEGRGEEAEAELDAALLQSPHWIEGHMQLAQLRSMLGRPALAADSLERALGQFRNHSGLWQARFDLRVKSENFRALDEDISSARSSGADAALLRPYEAIAASELEQTDRADALFAEIGHGLPIWRIRHLLRTGRAPDAVPLIERELAGPAAAGAWPYAALAWRLTGDPRSQWLEREGALVSVIDLKDELPPLDRLSKVLRSIHRAKGEYLDQSVRGGTQTDGPLFSRIEPEIRALRAAIVRAVEKYVAQLHAPVAGHPSLSQRRDRRIRFAGSWSVRLRDAGFHTSHVHPQGWISSALYVALPPLDGDAGAHAGWLHLGQPRSDLRLDLEPTRRIRPETGCLALFPSWMWHGTYPFPAGERLTVAFDVALPR
jgi:tetratricopeptide (TPR) repeat protein